MGIEVQNGERRVKHLCIGIVLDNSSSTEDIRELMNNCSRNLIKDMKHEVTFKNGTVEIFAVSFNSTYHTLVDFEKLDDISENALYIKESIGTTDTGAALLYALDRLQERKMNWKLEGEEYFQPMLFLLTDGYPDAGYVICADGSRKEASPERKAEVENAYRNAAFQIKQKEQEKKIVFVAAGLQRENGYGANMTRLRELSTYSERVIKVTENNNSNKGMKEFFSLIHEATTATLNGTPIDEIFGDILHGV